MSDEKQEEIRTISEEKPQENISPLKKFQQENDVLLMLYPKDINGTFFKSISPEDEITIYELLEKRDIEKEKLLILLDTSGGNVYSSVKIMDALRTKYKEITVAIPQEAKSSGTMMCCGADKLIMGSVSELGPLDKPMTHPENEKSIISASDIVKSIEGMIDIAVDRQKTLAREINEEEGIPFEKSLELASGSISKLISPMLCREDVKIYNQAKRLLAIAENYGSEFLKNFMLKYIKDDRKRQDIANIIIRRLVWLYPDHSFAIRRNELRDWLFVVKYAEDVDFWPELWNEFIQNIRNNQVKKVIKFL